MLWLLRTLPAEDPPCIDCLQTKSCCATNKVRIVGLVVTLVLLSLALGLGLGLSKQQQQANAAQGEPSLTGK